MDEDVNHLCEQVYELLGFMQEPKFSENLVSLTLTVKSILNLVTSAAMFLEDYFKPKLNGAPPTNCLTDVDSPPHQRSCQPRLQKTNFRGIRQAAHNYQEQPRYREGYQRKEVTICQETDSESHCVTFHRSFLSTWRRFHVRDQESRMGKWNRRSRSYVLIIPKRKLLYLLLLR